MRIEIKDSLYAKGKGTFTTESINAGNVVDVWVSKSPMGRKLIQESMIEPWYEAGVLGRYTNHSLTPNTFPKMEGDKIFLYSRGIGPGEEITADYTTLNGLIGYSANVNF